MARSFGGGGGTPGGGSMLRAVGRLVNTRTGVAGLQEPLPSNGAGNTAPTARPASPRSASGHKLHQLSLSSSSSPGNYSSPISPRLSGCGGAPSGASTWQNLLVCDEGEWVFADGGWEEEQRKDFFLDELVLGSVPSTDEVHGAVSAIQQAFDSTAYSHLIKDRYGPYVDKEITESADGSGLLHRISSGETEDDWIEPSIHLCTDSTGALRPCGSDRVFDAFHLLQTDPSVQRMVISLSSDKAVWDAVLNNEVVKELRKSCCAGEITSPPYESSDDEPTEPNEVAAVIKWMFDNTMSKILEMVDQMTKLVIALFCDVNSNHAATDRGGGGGGINGNPFEEKLRMSFLLSVVVLLVVAVTRSHRA